MVSQIGDLKQVRSLVAHYVHAGQEFLNTDVQHDAAQFVDLMRQAISEDLFRGGLEASMFDKLFTIEMEQVSICNQGHTYRVQEKESSLQLNIIENVTGKKISTLSTMLNAHFSLEKIDEHCFECNSEKRLQRNLVLGPELLVVQLKRFNNVLVDDKIVIQKETHDIQIEEQIDFAGQSYTLRNFILHIGSKCTGGHYKCIGICEKNGLCFSADDDKVRQISHEDMSKLLKASYVLLYERKGEQKEAHLNMQNENAGQVRKGNL